MNDSIRETPFRYLAFGLSIRSTFPIHSLLEAPEGTGVLRTSEEILIREGNVPVAISDPVEQSPVYQIRPGAFLLNLPAVGRYLVREGREIVVEPAHFAREHEIETFLLGSVIGALLHQRGTLILHASAVETPWGALLFAGKSGSGKSTLAATFMKRGYPLLADDVSAVATGGGAGAEIMPAYPQLRLWPDAIEFLGEDARALPAARPGLKKYLLPSSRFARAPVPFRRLYVLNAHNEKEIRFQPLEGKERAEAFFRNTYRQRYIRGLQRQQEYFHNVLSVVRHMTVISIIRPARVDTMKELADRIEAEVS